MSLISSEILKEEAVLGLKELENTLSRQIAIPTELLNWTRQIFKEGLKANIFEPYLYDIVRVKAIEEYYSHQQIEQTIERVKLELKGNTKEISQKFSKLSVN